MKDRIKKYVDDLLSQKIEVEEDIFSDKTENLNKENIELFVKFIKEIYKNKKIAIFMFPFLEKLDEYIIQPQNIDMIAYMFFTMESKLGNNFNIVMSGNFGLWVYKLIEEGKIDFKGGVLVISGKIRKVKEDENNPITILKQRGLDKLHFKDFVFVDDSYYSGGTHDKINEFLRKYYSFISKTFVFYTHNKVDPKENVFSFYCYSDYHDEDVIPIHKYVEYIKCIDLKDYEDIICDKIRNCKMGVKDLLKMIKRLHDNEKFYNIREEFIMKYKNFLSKNM
jgi:hypothetical protein